MILLIISISLSFPLITSNIGQRRAVWVTNTRETYLFLHSAELLNLDDEGSGSPLVLNSSDEGPGMVYAEGL